MKGKAHVGDRVRVTNAEYEKWYEQEGTVTAALPGGGYIVRLDDGTEPLLYADDIVRTDG